MGIEPTPEAWEAAVLPLNYARAPAEILMHFAAQPAGPVNSTRTRRSEAVQSAITQFKSKP